MIAPKILAVRPAIAANLADAKSRPDWGHSVITYRIARRILRSAGKV